MNGSVLELSPAGIYDLEADLRFLGHRIGLGWLQLVAQFRRLGSIPADDRVIARILGVGVRFMRERAWPLLQDRLVLSDDGRRYSCPDITPWGGRQRPPAPPPVPRPPSPQHQQAANIRHARERAAREAQAERLRTHAETHAESMRGASETHENSMRDASDSASLDASGASPRAGASPPLSKEDSFYQPTEKEAFLGGEETRADASPDAPAHAPTHENRMRSDAPRHAPGVQPIRPSLRPIPADWKPSEHTRADAERLGVPVDAELAKFVLDARGNGHTAADWDARFLIWCHREVEFQRRNPRPPAPIAAESASAEVSAAEQAEAAALDEAAKGSGPAAQLARVKRRLRNKAGPAEYRNWLAKMALVPSEGDDVDEVSVGLPSAFLRDRVNSQYGHLLRRAWQAENPAIRRVKVVVAGAP